MYMTNTGDCSIINDQCPYNYNDCKQCALYRAVEKVKNESCVVQVTNAGELISRNALLESLIYCEDLKGRRTTEAVAKLIKDAPPVEATPTVYGEWETSDSWDLFVCHDCGHAYDEGHNYCPYCGRKMKKGGAV